MKYEHGTSAGYTLGGCRCGLCRQAHGDYKNHRTRQIAYGRWQPLVDAQPVREHVQLLGEFGLGWKRIAGLADVPEFTVGRLLYGAPLERRAPSKRIKTQTAEKLLALRPNLDILPDTATISSAGTQRRIQALSVVGWSIPQQARLLGRKPSNYASILARPKVTAATARDVRALCEELWNTAPPETTPAERMSASKARAAARRNNWVPLATWDEDLIELPPRWLKIELRRQAERMTHEEASRCYTAHRKHGDVSPLVVAGSLEYKRRQHRRERAAQS
ncbi:hypothetical protein ACFQVD_26750 [Streptosporangium amethystogenes subsp. fukuiense]|uniref:Uncharacterized protein n=1 Tax=Streptosporangium amethystogenes subsp. fukuiense TaxID=698418 RepID=A0ABW2T5S1_9ACTN